MVDAALVQIRRSSKSRKREDRLRQVKLAPPFFLVGLMVGILGLTYLGVHLWLMRTGQIAIAPNYLEIRRLHAVLQIHGFFGAFISGFILQAAPRLLGSQRVRPAWTTVLLPLLFIALCMVFVWPNARAGYYVLTVHFLAIAAVCVRYAWSATWQARMHAGTFLLLTSAALGCGALLDISDSLVACAVLWLGVGPAIICSLQLVFFRLVGMQQFELWESVLALCLFFVSFFAFCSISIDAQFLNPALKIAGSCFVLIALLLLRSMWRGRPEMLPEFKPVAWAAWIGAMWLGLAGGYLTQGAQFSDITVHLFATGFAFPILFIVSSQIVGALSGSPVLSPRIACALLICWQIVPLVRGVFAHMAVWPGFHWVLGVTATVVFIVWSAALSWRIVPGLIPRSGV